MPLHHFLPHASTVAVILSSTLAGAAVYYALKRDRLHALTDGLGSRFDAFFSRGASVAATGGGFQTTTGNAAFNDYRNETLRKLEVEAAEFRAYLQNLRAASDRAEFEAFLKARKDQSATSV